MNIPIKWASREWLTLKEAAEFFSGILSPDIGEADLVRLALDKRLAMSVFFPQEVVLRTVLKFPGVDVAGRIFFLEAIERQLNAIRNEPRGSGIIPIVKKERESRLHRSCQLTSGIFDFPLVFSQRNIVLEKWYALIGDPIEPTGCYSICVTQGSAVWQVQEKILAGCETDDGLKYCAAKSLGFNGRLVIRVSELVRLQLEFDKSRVLDRGGEKSLLENEQKWPWGDHDTRQLRWLTLAAKEWWEPYLKTRRAPKKELIVPWIMSESQKAGDCLSENAAKAIATLLRPHDMRPGQKKK